MPIRPTAILADATVKAELHRAWLESSPGPRGGSEEGGFIVRQADGSLRVIRWPRGAQTSIAVPPHPEGQVDGCEIIASFHTHPNTGPDFLQEPGETDRRGVRDDPDLKQPGFVGEFVLANELIFLVTPAGSVREVGGRIDLIGE